MERVCAWCRKPMGQRKPVSDHSETSGICGPCKKKLIAKSHDQIEKGVETNDAKTRNA